MWPSLYSLLSRIYTYIRLDYKVISFFIHLAQSLLIHWFLSVVETLIWILLLLRIIPFICARSLVFLPPLSHWSLKILHTNSNLSSSPLVKSSSKTILTKCRQMNRDRRNRDKNRLSAIHLMRKTLFPLIKMMIKFKYNELEDHQNKFNCLRIVSLSHLRASCSTQHNGHTKTKCQNVCMR